MKDAIQILKKAIDSLKSHQAEKLMTKAELETNLKQVTADLTIYDQRLAALDEAITKLEQSNVKPKNKKA